MSVTSGEERISEGDDVLLFLDNRKTYLVKVKRGENPTEFFTKHQRRGLRKKGILVIAGNKIILTETAIKLLEAGHDE